MDTANGKTRLEASAATWTSRADLLLRLELLHEARRAAGSLDGEKTGETRIAGMQDPAGSED